MRWLKKTVLEIPVLAWVFSLAVAAAIPFLVFHLIVSPVWAASTIAAIFVVGWLVRRHLTNPLLKDDDEHGGWITDIVSSVSLYAYIWIFLDRGFWAIALYIAITLHFAYQIAVSFRVQTESQESGPSDMPWFN